MLAEIDGPNLKLRLIKPEDAEYVYGLRTSPAYSRYLTKVYGAVEDQRQWITAYKLREAAQLELYYIIERKDGVRCGTVRLYDIGIDTFTWGSWVLDHNKTQKAALESAVLSFGIGFGSLNRSLAFVDVRIENELAWSFYVRFGMTEIRRDCSNIYFVYSREKFLQHCGRYMDIIKRGL